jgi:hypothetical protein
MWGMNFMPDTKETVSRTEKETLHVADTSAYVAYT